MIKPLGDKVLLKMLETEEVTKSGIVLPTQSKEKSQIAEVIAVGSGIIEDGKKIEMEVKVGNQVIIGKYSGTEFKHEDIEYLIVSQKEILGIIE